MKTTKISYALASIVLASALVFTSCKKDKEEDDRDTAAATDNSYSENAASDLETIGGQALDNNGNTLSTYRMGGTPDEAFMLGCATVVVDTTLKTATVSFNGSVCADGRLRSGSVTFNYSSSTNGAKHYRTPGFRCVITTQSYTVDGNQVQVNNKTIENTTPIGFNPATTNLTWTIVSDIKITKVNGEIVTWQCTRNKTLLNTNDVNVYVNDQTPIVWTKAKVGLTGSASGVTAAGNSYTSTITSQLVRDFNCAPDASKPHRHPFIQGAIDFTPAGKLTRNINFGSGACDLTATVTIGNWTHTYTM